MILLLQLACLRDFNGTVVGNPGSESSAKFAPTSGFDYAEGSMSIDSVSYQGSCPSGYSPSGEYCPEDTDVTTVETMVSLDLMDGTSSLVLLEGSWTAIIFQLSGPILLKGVDDSDQVFDLSFSVDSLRFASDDPHELYGDYILELGEPEWLSDRELDDMDSLQDVIRSSSGFYPDSDGDGEVAAGEREAGFVSDPE